ncbi:NUDIX domain-containing protein [Elioraea sp.]|uniref:NUDIX hydrolase n=1 Tax=Elioraea sp. TaxID=2185103 RepID=UPI0021DDF19D|nr:NUDIX domain-containing protein [Elioraea sp.]GIX08349.1 MAG: NUDIX hydrolase [Elioraea sp.]
MTSAALPLPPHPPRPPGTRAARPRAAASLVLLRRTGDGPAVLMGVRSGGHRFMPNRLVFPGGRVEAADHRVPFAAPPPPALADSFGPHAAALAAAAIRETFEETGLRLAAPAPPGVRLPRGRGWAEFSAGGVLPAGDALVPLCRLVTPAFSPIRFDARFLLAPAERVSGELGGNGELEFLRWIPLAEAETLDLALPQRVVLREVAEWLRAAPAARAARRAPLWRELGASLVRVPPL